MPFIKCPECAQEVSDAASACPKCGRPLIPASQAETAAIIKELLANGRKIEAVKLYRERVPGTGLAEAKDAVERIERGEAIAERPAAAAPHSELDASLTKILTSEGKVAAIKFYRDHQPGTGLKDAKEYVDRLESALSPATRAKIPKSGCASVLVFTVLLAAGAAWAAARLGS
jgi:ribosomal protein L7/L12